MYWLKGDTPSKMTGPGLTGTLFGFSSFVWYCVEFRLENSIFDVTNRAIVFSDQKFRI